MGLHNFPPGGWGFRKINSANLWAQIFAESLGKNSSAVRKLVYLNWMTSIASTTGAFYVISGDGCLQKRILA